jgi:hypothetical protein
MLRKSCDGISKHSHPVHQRIDAAVRERQKDVQRTSRLLDQLRA